MPKQEQTRQNRIRLVEYSSSEVSDPSEVPQIDGKLIFLVSQGSQAEFAWAR